MSIGRVPGVTGIQPSIVDAKGDLIVATAADSVDRLAVGANNTVLTADSATATGLKWATPATANYVGASAQGGVSQSLANNTNTALSFTGTDLWDTDAYHNPSSNPTRFTIPSGKAGKYLVCGNAYFQANATGQRTTTVFKNGAFVIFTDGFNAASAGATNVHWNAIVDCAVGDYLEFYASQNSGGNLAIYTDFAGGSQFTITYLGA